MRRLLPWLLLVLIGYAAWRWQRACRGDGWDVLDRAIGTVDAPPDWSTEHDHYLYGTPKQRACRGWNDAAALAVWQHDVAALSDGQIDALHALLVRHVER